MDVFAEVKKDLDARNDLGHQLYGKTMQPHDGRNSLLDAYEEALDLVVYLKKALMEAGIHGQTPEARWETARP